MNLKRIKYLVMFVFIATLFVVSYLWVLYQKIGNSSLSNSSETTQINSIDNTQGRLENGVFQYPLGNFQLTIEPGWVLVPTQTVKLPAELTGTRFAFQKQSASSCVVAYVRTHGGDSYRQTSFGTRVLTQDNDQLDGSWYTPEKNLPGDFQFSNYKRQYFNNEVRKVYYPSFYNDPVKDYFNVFILFSPEGKSVPDDCDTDFSKMLTSIKITFNTISLTQESKGVAYIQNALNPPKLLFVPDDTGIANEVMQFGLGSHSIATVWNNKLVTSSGDKIMTTDIFSKTISVLPGILQIPGEIVNTFHIDKNKLWYLYGPNCTGYLEKCDLKLVEYTFDNASSKILARGLASRSIIGYDPVNDTLRLTHAEGDAGCFWESGEEYSFRDNRLRKIGEISECEGDPKPTSSAITQWFQENQTLSTQQKIDTAMRIQGGVISFPNNTYPTPGNRSSIKF